MMDGRAYLKTYFGETSRTPYPKEFIRFLLDYGIYDAFIQNFCTASDAWRPLYHKGCCCEPKNYVRHAFPWPFHNGHFWLSMHRQWLERLAEIKKKFAAELFMK